jgi:Polyketide cyclase / dehydrase and lipid transport
MERLMRITNLVSFALVAFAISTTSASAIEVKRRTEVPGEPQTIWSFAGDFCAIKDWHPLVADCQETKEGDVTYRTLTLKDGGKIKEKLTDKDDTSYSYEIVESPLPVKNYKAKFWVEPDDEPERTAVYWEAEFDANGASDEDARKKIFDVLVAGMKGIKQMALKKTPGTSDHD